MRAQSCTGRVAEMHRLGASSIAYAYTALFANMYIQCNLCGQPYAHSGSVDDEILHLWSAKWDKNATRAHDASTSKR